MRRARVQATLVDEEPGRFFVPPYVGHRGWVGVRLDVDVDWDEVAGIVEDGFREVATKRLIAEHDPMSHDGRAFRWQSSRWVTASSSATSSR